MTTIALTPEGEAFLARVRDELADLPPDERDELLEDIESHLAEVTGEGSLPLAVRLGSAEEFAQELRHSAGLPPRAAPVADSRLDVLRARARRTVRRGDALRSHIDAALLWQVARGWLLAVAIAVVIGEIGSTSAWGYAHAWLPHAGFRGTGAGIALVAIVAVSIALGRRAAAGRAVTLDRAASAIALIALIPAAWHMDSPPRAPAFTPAGAFTTSVEYRSTPGLALNGVEIKNLFPYTRDGEPLNDVMLYLPDGRPLNVGALDVEPDRRYLVDRRGRRLYNSFPARYFDPGTLRVTHPNAGPHVRVPTILTPPLNTETP